MARAYISIGSNVDREVHVRAAIQALAECYGALTVSPVYETGAVGFDGEPFLNLAVGFETDAGPETLVRDLKALERAQGRTAESNGFKPRTLDLDLLLYDDLVLQTEAFELPRDEILHHAFVLAPWPTSHPTCAIRWWVEPSRNCGRRLTWTGSGCGRWN